MNNKVLRINKNGETLTITKSSAETGGNITEFLGSEEPGIGQLNELCNLAFN